MLLFGSVPSVRVARSIPYRRTAEIDLYEPPTGRAVWSEKDAQRLDAPNPCNPDPYDESGRCRPEEEGAVRIE